jgi:hypothetical protein
MPDCGIAPLHSLPYASLKHHGSAIRHYDAVWGFGRGMG